VLVKIARQKKLLDEWIAAGCPVEEKRRPKSKIKAPSSGSRSGAYADSLLKVLPARQMELPLPA